MKTTICMYNESIYDSWEQAEKLGGVYSTSVNSSIVEEVSQAILVACTMVDGNAKINLRLEEIKP